MLSPDQVRAAVDACYSAFLRDYSDAKLVECFPALDACVVEHAGVPSHECEAIALTIAQHEVGRVPKWAARAIRAIAERRPVVVVSNIWAPSHHWRGELTSSGIASSFSATVFSTDLGAIKPSPRPFLSGLEAVAASPAEVLFVGDSLERDIYPAKLLGMATCLVGTSAPEGSADFCVRSIVELTQ
ncbi:MAG: HAD family hydrolase [Alcaligenaceae bacterium]|nr:MAG: HAD family hydrolase [Alcaligenaceae bacterium]